MAMAGKSVKARLTQTICFLAEIGRLAVVILALALLIAWSLNHFPGRVF